MPVPRILISGLNGYLGQYLLACQPPSIELAGTIRPQSILQIPSFLSGLELVKLSLEEEIEAQFQDITTDILIHTAALANLAVCENAPKLAEKVNSQASGALARWCAKRRIRMIYLSTDIVFDGEHPPYSEDDLARPVNVYGKTKWLGEKAIQEELSDFVIIRISLALGPGRGGRRNFVDWFMDKINSKQEIPLFYDEIRTPTAVRILAEKIWQIALSTVTGTFHLCGERSIDRYELGRIICQKLGQGLDLLRPISVKTMNDYPRPVDVSLKSDRLFQGQPLKIAGIDDLIDDILPRFA